MLVTLVLGRLKQEDQELQLAYNETLSPNNNQLNSEKS